MGALVREWVLRSSGRRAWVLSRGGLAAGVMVVRRRLGPTCWEVSCLQTSNGDDHAMLDLLEGAGQAVGQVGGQKLFLRLPADSPLEELARQAHFCPSVAETLYTRRHFVRDGSFPTPSAILRPASAEDEHQLYRLYQAVVPAPAREAQGLTFSEWRDGLDLPRDWRWHDSLVLERDGAIVGWATLSGNRRTAVLDALVEPQGLDHADALLATALQGARPGQALLCLVPSYQHALAGPLGAQGFEKAGDLILYVRHITVRVKEPELLPVGALPR